MELATIAQRAVEAAQAAGATDAEAYAQDSVGREIRIFDGEVESLTDAGQRGLGVRCWIDHRSGYAYGTDLSDEGLGQLQSQVLVHRRGFDRPRQHGFCARKVLAVHRVLGIGECGGRTARGRRGR